MRNMMNQLIIEGTVREIIEKNSDEWIVKIENAHKENINIITVCISTKLFNNNATNIGNTLRIVGYLMEMNNNIVICAEHIEYKINNN